jgi:PAS domain S-box-containing protein
VDATSDDRTTGPICPGRASPASGPPSGADAVTFSDRMFRDLFHTLADAVVVADDDGTIVLWNAAAERLFGWSAHDAIGQTLDILIPERLRARHWAGYERTMATGQTTYGERLLEVPATHRDGRTLSVAFTVTLLRDDTGRHVIAAVMRDDTARWQERRRMKAELEALSRTDQT